MTRLSGQWQEYEETFLAAMVMLPGQVLHRWPKLMMSATDSFLPHSQLRSACACLMSAVDQSYKPRSIVSDRGG